MQVPDWNAQQADLVGNLRTRITELERECKRLRGRSADGASICRDPKARPHALEKAATVLERAEHAAGLGYCEWDPVSGRCVSASAGLKRLLGLDDKTDLTARRFHDSIHVDDRRRYRELIRRQRRAGDRYAVTYLVARSDGSVIDVREVGEPIPQVNGGPETWLSWVQDITAQRERERQIERSREKYRDLIVGSIEGIGIVRDGRMLFANQAIADIFGYADPEELCALESVDCLIAPHERERVRSYRSERSRGEATPSRFVAQLVCKDGTLIWGECLAQSVNWDDGRALQVTLIDITDRIEAEAAHQASEQRFKDFAQSSSDWFWEVGPDLRFAWFSRPGPDLGYTADNMIGKTRIEIAGGDSGDPIWREHLADMEARRPFRDFRYVGHDPDGGEVHVSVSGVPVFDGDGTFLGYRGTGVDVTAEVRAHQRAVRSERQLLDAIEAIEDGFTLYDSEDRILLVNEKCRKSLPGVADLLRPGTYWEDLVRAHLERGVLDVPKEHHAAWLRKHGEIHRSGGVRHYRTSDGRWVELRDHRTHDGGYVTIRADITEMKEAERALALSEQRFRDFAEASSDWFWETGPDHRFTWLSEGAASTTGVRSQDMIGNNRLAFRKPNKDNQQWQEHLADLAAHRPFKNFRYKHTVGIYVSVSGKPRFDESGTFLGYRGTASDITAQVQADQEVAKARGMLADAIQSVRDGFAMFDRNDRLVLANNGFRQRVAPIWDDLGDDPTWHTIFRGMVEHGLMKAPAEDLEGWIRRQAKVQHERPLTRQIESGDGRLFEIRTYPTADGGFAFVRHEITALRQAEQQLKESEQRFKDFAQSSSDWFWETGPDHRFTWLWEGASGGLGAEQVAMIGETRQAFAPQGAEPERWQQHLADLEAHRPFKDFRYRRTDGVAVSVSGIPRFDENGSFLGYRGSASDVTTQVRAEQEVAKARALLSHAIESVRGGIALFDRQDQLILCNSGFRQHLGPIEHLLGQNFTWPAMIRALVKHHLIKDPAGGVEAYIQRHGRVQHEAPTMRHVRSSDGRVMELRSYPAQDGGFAVVRTDITELRRAQEALRQNEQRFKDFAESSSDWFWEMGPDLRFTWFSLESRLIGKTRLEAGGGDPSSEQWRAHLADLEARRPFKDFRYRLASQEEEMYLSVSGVPILDSEGTFLGYRGTTSDITAHVLAEREVADARALLEDAVESVTDGFAMYDSQDRLILCNDGYRMGIEEVCDDLEPNFRWPDFFRAMVDRRLIKPPADDLDAWIQHQSEVQRVGPSLREIETTSGRFIEIRTYPMRGGGFASIRRDVTELRRAQQEVAKARAMLTDAVDSIVDGLAMYDKDDRLVLANQGYRKRFLPLLDCLGDDITWPNMMRAMVRRNVVKCPCEDAEAWIREQTEAHHSGPCIRQVETGDGRFIEIHSYPTRDGGFTSVRHDVTALKRAEQALKESEQRFRDFAGASSDWFWEMGPDLRFSWFSDQFLRDTGIRARHLIGKTRREVASLGGDDESWRQHLADLNAHRAFKDFRYRTYNEAAGEIHVSVSGVPRFDADGTFLGYRGTATDITAQVRAEREAARAHEVLTDALETIEDGFVLTDADDRVVMFNESTRRFLVGNVGEMLQLGRTWGEVMAARAERGGFEIPDGQPIEAWLAEQQEARRRGGVRSYQTTNGRWLQVRDRRTRDGGCVTIRTDITEIKRAEQRLRESEQRFRDFAESSSDWFWEMGADLRFTWFSRHDLGGTGATAADLIGHTRQILAITEAEKRAEAAHLADLQARRSFRDFRCRVTDVQGRYAFLSVSGMPLFDAEGTFLGYRGTGKNVTVEVEAEQRAARAQAMLSDAIESIREGCALFDKDDRLVLYNENFRKSLAKLDDLIEPGMLWETGFRAQVERGQVKVPVEDREGWIAEQISLHRKPGAIRVMENHAGRWKELREYPTSDGGLVLIGADITELKQAEIALRESETLLKHAAQIANLGHWVWDVQTKEFVHCSDGLARMYGTTPEAYAAQHRTGSASNPMIAEDRARYEDVIGRAVRLQKGYDIEFRERRPDGTIRHMRERGEPVLDASGTLVRIVGVIQDITKHKRAEEALQRTHAELEMRVDERTAALRAANQALRREIVEHERTEEALRESRVLLETIVETAAMGINVKDPSLRYLFMNGYQANVYGVSPRHAVGKTPGELIGRDYGTYIESLDRKVLQSGKPWPHFEEEIRDKDGALRTWLTAKMPVRFEGGAVRYIVTTSLDITELKARERDLKQAQKMDAVGKLTGGIAHDFNNLLFVIRGNVALLKDEIRDSNTARECLSAIQDAAKLGADLTRSLLAFSRQQPLKPAIADLPEVIAHTASTLLRPFEKSIDIQTSYPRNVWPVLIDRHQLENSLLNLALNARDAMPNGGTLRISVINFRSEAPRNGHGQRIPPGEYVRLVVADSGVGMLPEVIDRAFEPFFTTKVVGSGTGLGLSMVYGFIKQSGGYIDIESKLGQGTTITMHLPRTSNAEKKPAKTATDPRWVAQGTETILVTEDDPAVRRVAVRILSKLGYRTLEASNGAEALEVLRSDAAIDLLFADIILAGEMNGAQLSHEAQRLRPDLKVLFASGYSEPAVLRETDGAGRVPLLSKPYDADELGRLVRGLLDGGREANGASTANRRG